MSGLGKTKLLDDGDILVLLEDHVFAYDADIDNLLFDILWNIIIAEEEYLNREIYCSCFKDASSVGEFYAALFEQLVGVFAQTPAFLDCNFQFTHFLLK